MQRRPLSICALAASALLTVGAPSILTSTLNAATAETDPVGFVKVVALGSSDTIISLPLNRPPAFTGVVDSASGGLVTVQGTNPFTVDQFVYASPAQTNRYYLRVGGGDREGFWYEISDNDATSVTVDPNGDTLATVLPNGTPVQIIPFWTFGTAFPNQTGIKGSGSPAGASAPTEVLVPDTTTAGTNLASTQSYYYYTGVASGGAGWRRKGGGVTTIRNDDVIVPDVPLTIRHNTAGNTEIYVLGDVQMVGYRAIVGTLNANTDQDNPISFNVPVPVSLFDSNLFQSGAIAGTTNLAGSNAEELLVYDNTTAVINKAAGQSYYYYTGAAAGGAGWRLKGGGTSNIKNSELIFQPGFGYLIRKKGQAVPSSTFWSYAPTYTE